MAHMGQWKRSKTLNKAEIPITSSTCHAGFSTVNFHNDICLLRLERAVVLNEYISPICLPLSCYWQSKDLECYDMIVAGWGYIQVKPNPVNPDVVQKVRVEVKNQKYCQDQWKGKSIIRDDQLCAEADSKYKTPCPGDSGGPLMLETALRGKSVYYFMGIVSKGWPCDRLHEALIPPTIYTRITSYMKWMLDHIAE